MTDAGAPPEPAPDVVSLVRDGQAKFASGEVDEARTAFAKALKLKPDDAGAKAGLERCERLLAERESEPAPAPEPAATPPWPSGSDDFPDSGEAPEATIVDPNYLLGMDMRGPEPGASGEFPEPLTVPRGAIEKKGELPPPPDPNNPHREPSYPRYVSTIPGNYPEVQPGGRPSTSSPPPTSSATPLPGPLPVVAYPQMPPGGPSAYPQYATPAGGYIPTPPPMAFLPLQDRRRMMIIIGSVGGGCLLLGLLLGWAIFGAGDEDEPKAGTTAPLVAHDAGNIVPRDTAPVKPAAGTTATSARVSAVERPVLAVVTAPSAGQVGKLHARAAAQVQAGSKLFTIKGDKKEKTPDTILEAPKAGRLEVRAGEGDAVAEGDVLALLVDPDAWLLVVDLTGDALTPAWRCEVASGDGVSRSPCRIESVQPIGGGRLRATARVAARDAGWLKGDETDLALTLTPP